LLAAQADRGIHRMNRSGEPLADNAPHVIAGTIPLTIRCGLEAFQVQQR